MKRTRGILIETGSHGSATRFGIAVDLFHDPFSYYRRHVEPWIDDHGVEDILWHRPFGEFVHDLGQDADTIWRHFNGQGDPRFARSMAGVLAHLAQQARLTLYVGAIWQADLARLRDAGDYAEWARRVWLQFRMFSSNPKTRFVLDGSSNSQEMKPTDCMAARLLAEILGPERVFVEALPRDEFTSMHGMPGFIFENVWLSTGYNFQAGAANCKSVTRVLSLHAVNLTDPLRFAADCAAKGHDWYVCPHVLRRHSVTYEQMVGEG